MEILKVLGFKRHSSAKHCIEKNSEGPNVHKEAFITLVNNDFRSQISRSSALLLNDLALLYDLGDTEIADLNSFLTVKEYIV